MGELFARVEIDLWNAANFDFGQVRRIPKPGGLLENAGLEEQQTKLGKREGARQFGHRVCAFAAQYATLFQARTVVLSGGVIAHNWNDMSATVTAAFAQSIPRWMEDAPTLIASSWGQDAALVGAARYAYGCQSRPTE